MATPRSPVPVLLSSLLALAVVGGVVYLAVSAPADEGGGTSATRAADAPADPSEETGDARPFAIPMPAGCGVPDPARAPRLVLELPDEGKGLDFGKVGQSARLTREVAFTNAGEGLLCIGRVHSGCGCIKAKLAEPDRKRFAPGEGGTVLVLLDSTGRHGHITKSVTIHTNELDEPVHRFRVRADISLGVVADPQVLHFPPVPKDTPSSVTVELRSPEDESPWEVTSVRGTAKIDGAPVAYRWETERVDDPRFFRIRLDLTHPGLATAGRWRDGVVVETTHPDRPEILLQANVNVVDRVRANLHAVTLGYVTAGRASLAVRVRLIGAEGVRFDVEDVAIVGAPESTTTGFSAETGQDERGWYVDVRYDGSVDEVGLLERELVVRTDDAGTPELRLPIRATLRPPR